MVGMQFTTVETMYLKRSITNMLHDITKHIYQKTIKLFGLQVQTENGFEDIDSINITEKQEHYLIKTENHYLLCSQNHILIDENDNEVYAKDSVGVNIKIDDGICEKVILCEKTDINDNLYDISLKSGTSHKYYTNGMLSHNCVIWDEAAFTANNISDKVFTSIYPVISSSKNSKFIMVSTPNGVDSRQVYYQCYSKALNASKSKNEEGWKLFRFDWWDVPGRDETWKKKTIESIGELRFRQEFGNEFLASQSYKKLISDEKIEQFRRKISEWKEKNQNQGKDLFINSKDKSKTYTFKMYHEFNPSHTYIASGDCGEGIGGDSSVLYVWDITYTSNIKLCMKFADNRIPLIEFAYVTNQILKLYANPFLAVESNGIGVGYIEQLRMVYNYENLVRLNREGGYGIQSHSTVKSKACLWLKAMMDTEGFGFEIYDKELVEEMPTFIKKDTVKNDIFVALGDNHDDFIMSFIWMAWMLNEENLEKYFIVTDWFVSKVGKQLPQTIQPLGEYKYKDIVAISNDPVYKDFIEFKKMMQEKYQNMIDIEREKNGMDVFQMEQMQSMNNRQIMEIKKQRANYNQGGGCLFSCGGGFHDESGYYDDWGGGSWN